MICKNCGKEIPENTKFCGHCGEVTDKEPPVLDMPPPPDKPPKEAKSGEIPGPKKKRRKLFMFILSFALFLGTLTGMWGAYYVAKNGWEDVPLAQKFEFLPFVKFEKEKIETYSVPIYDETGGDNKKE